MFSALSLIHTTHVEPLSVNVLPVAQRVQELAMAIAETNGQRLVACGKYSDNNDIPSAEVERIIDEFFQPMHISDVTRVRWFLAKYDPPEAMDFTKFVDVAREPAFTDKEKRQAILFHAVRGD